MTFPRGQTFSFHGRDAKARAEQLIKEEGADMVEVIYHRDGVSKVRLLREFVIESTTTQRLRTERQSNLLCQS